jgi:prepilin-type N-terminal cleavage/methylation domain-containing protein
MPHQPSAHAAGFTLVEVLVALSLLACAALGMADLVLRSVNAVYAARQQTIATTLAIDRMEQLRGLSWGLGDAVVPGPLSDTTTGFATSRPAPGGTGLQPSPPSAADVNTAGFMDTADSQGRWMSGGAVVPAGAGFVRRWGVSTLAGTADSLVLQVTVAGTGTSPTASRLVKLVAIKSRTAY